MTRLERELFGGAPVEEVERQHARREQRRDEEQEARAREAAARVPRVASALVSRVAGALVSRVAGALVLAGASVRRGVAGPARGFGRGESARV
jgi:hypothetical protein